MRLFAYVTDERRRLFSNANSVANSSPPLRHYFERSCVTVRNDAEMGPINSLHAFGVIERENEDLILLYSGT